MAEVAAAPTGYALRRLRKGWRSGELMILTLALAVAVAAVAAVSLFTGRLNEAIALQTGETLGADLMLTSRDPLPKEVTKAAQATGATLAPVVQFPSVVLRGEATALASMKVVTADYPLRGVVRIADQPFGPARIAVGGPGPGEAWVDLRLWQDLSLEGGAIVQAGASQLVVRALIVDEPGRGVGFSDLAPRFLMNAADLPATGLLGPAARAQYFLQATGTPAQVQALKELQLPLGVRRVSPEDARPELKAALRNSAEFLGIARLAAALLAAAAVALCAAQWGVKLRDEVALLKCLGASRAWVLRALVLNLLALGAVAGGVGALLGVGAQEVVARMLGTLMQVQLPAPSLLPLLQAWFVALLLLIGFALPPILQACATSPIRVFQRDERVAGRRLPAVSAAIAVIALLWTQTQTWQAAALVLGGAVLVAGLLALNAWLLVLLLTPLKRAVGTSWRFGLGNVARRRGSTVAQAVALGLALLALLLVSVVRQDLLSTWRNRLPPNTPNQFLINIQPDQVEPLQAFLLSKGVTDARFWPMARGRLVALRGQPVTAETFDDPETRRWIDRDFNLSWSAELNPDNEITQGEWWGEAGRGMPWMSADEYAVERLGLKLGDTLTLDFAGTQIEFTIHNLRTVKWDSFRPNFFLLAPPGVLEEKAAAQWLTSFHLAPDRRSLLRELIQGYPNVTVLDIESLMTQVRTMMDRIIGAVEFIFLFTLAAGLTVLLAAIEGTRGERVREAGLLRALGARSSVIAKGLIAEYAVLGLLAGTIAAIAAQVIAWLLAEQVFKLPYGLRPSLWLVGAGVGALLVTTLGWWSLRGTLRTPPDRVLRGPT
ncbi:MAG TPA: FtsX-like permease family protein [Verrucomicrobiae bacterium]|nr:FtsX-like permease family protein [Verrucomicrobiae bacterium]